MLLGLDFVFSSSDAGRQDLDLVCTTRCQATDEVASSSESVLLKHWGKVTNAAWQTGFRDIDAAEDAYFELQLMWLIKIFIYFIRNMGWQSPKHIFRLGVVVLSLFLLGGCAGPKQAELKAPTRMTALVLETPIVWRQSDNWTGEMESTLAAGKYVIVGEDDEGSYLKGSANCYAEKAIAPNWNSAGFKRGDIFTVECGVYVPFDRSRGIRLFSVEGTGSMFRAKDGTTTAPGDASNMDATIADTATLVSVNSSASPLQTGVGVALGAAIAGAMLDLRKGSLQKNNVIKPPPALIDEVQKQLRD